MKNLRRIPSSLWSSLKDKLYHKAVSTNRGPVKALGTVRLITDEEMGTVRLITDMVTISRAHFRKGMVTIGSISARRCNGKMRVLTFEGGKKEFRCFDCGLVFWEPG